jgi:hypothetical protein
MWRKALPISIAVGVAWALGLTAIRGGWRDAPSVLAIFGGSGFCISYAICALLLSKSLGSIDAAGARSFRVRLVRDILGVALVVAVLTYSGPVVQGGGYGGWLVALFLGVVCPLVIALVTYHCAVLLGALGAASISVSTLLYNPYHPGRWFQPSAWAQVSHQDVSIGAWVAGFLVVLSLAVSVPVAVRRRHITSRCCGPARVAS